MLRRSLFCGIAVAGTNAVAGYGDRVRRARKGWFSRKRCAVFGRLRRLLAAAKRSASRVRGTSESPSLPERPEGPSVPRCRAPRLGGAWCLRERSECRLGRASLFRWSRERSERELGAALALQRSRKSKIFLIGRERSSRRPRGGKAAAQPRKAAKRPFLWTCKGRGKRGATRLGKANGEAVSNRCQAVPRAFRKTFGPRPS